MNEFNNHRGKVSYKRTKNGAKTAPLQGSGRIQQEAGRKKRLKQKISHSFTEFIRFFGMNPMTSLKV